VTYIRRQLVVCTVCYKVCQLLSRWNSVGLQLLMALCAIVLDRWVISIGKKNGLNGILRNLNYCYEKYDFLFMLLAVCVMSVHSE